MGIPRRQVVSDGFCTFSVRSANATLALKHSSAHPFPQRTFPLATSSPEKLAVAGAALTSCPMGVLGVW